MLRNDPALLARRGDVDALIALLGHRRRMRRAAAAGLLRDFGGERVGAALLGALEDSSWIVRQLALDSLIEIDPNRPAEPVVAALRRRAGREDGSWPPDASEMLKLGIWRLQSLRPVEVLVDALLSDSLTEAEPRLARVNRAIAISCLGDLGDARALEAVVAGLEDEDRGVRGAAAEALGKLGDVRGVEPLIRALEDDDTVVRRQAMRALSEFDDDRAFRALQAAAARGRVRDRWAAVRALRRARRRRVRR